MKQKQVRQLQLVLKVEQQTLDSYLQLLRLELSQLNKIRAELYSLTSLRETVLSPQESTTTCYDIDAARNRFEFIQNLEATFVKTVDSESKQLELITNEKQKVNKQRTRVQAIEKMISRMKNDVQMSQNYFETIELGDIVLNKFMENKS